ncbi:histidine kinase [Corynebacterium sp. P7202]|uniref:histidine kinase n=1 Tax=Corynebacterium pygosceleis TaxID=2800406 RepID=A0A9Q4GIY3_9CORY|nr:histidine kinase [Corynebacterium pygosceleis]MCK7636801.1 histidine kinase [Corynebacterium pygosceleis]MCX7467554.1 histidine kinase [Corynebacterium pygosceleis]
MPPAATRSGATAAFRERVRAAVGGSAHAFCYVFCASGVILLDAGGHTDTLSSVLYLIVACVLLVAPGYPAVAVGTTGIVLAAVLLRGLPGGPVAGAVAVAYCAFLTAARITSRVRFVYLGAMLLGATVALSMLWNVSLFPAGGRLPVVMLAVALVSSWTWVAFFWMLGDSSRRRRDNLEALRQRAELAGVVERTRIAREMHDIVAHSLAAVISLADGARFAARRDPQAAVDTLELIAETSRESLEQMRGLLSVLRDETGRSESAPPGAADIPGLIADARRSGLRLSVRGTETIPGDLPQLSQMTLYRLVQEMLTNMLRHGDGTGELTVTDTGRAVTVTATNPVGRTGSAGASGFGVTGMRERLRAVGGRLDVADTGARFVVTAVVPR